ASIIVIVWAATGPLFGFSDTWQLVINTGTTVLTFLAVFLIQNTQNRDALAIHLKLDELLRGVEGARTGLVSLEALPEKELEQLDNEFHKLGEVEHEAEGLVAEELKSRRPRGPRRSPASARRGPARGQPGKATRSR